jgi:hypothetical protein
MDYISRARAQVAFADGKKIAHRLFLDSEFIKLNSDKEMEDENGLVLNKQDFWIQRGSKEFDNGWYIFE